MVDIFSTGRRRRRYDALFWFNFKTNKVEIETSSSIYVIHNEKTEIVEGHQKEREGRDVKRGLGGRSWEQIGETEKKQTPSKHDKNAIDKFQKRRFATLFFSIIETTSISFSLPQTILFILSYYFHSLIFEDSNKADIKGKKSLSLKIIKLKQGVNGLLLLIGSF